MRRLPLFTIIIGLITVTLEFRKIKVVWEIFPISVAFYYLLLILLFTVTIINFFRNKTLYRKTNNISSFIPFGTGLLLLLLTFVHSLVRSHLDNGPTLFTSYNYDLGAEGGFHLYLKKNSHLKGERIDKFSETNYWGSYTKHGDTIILDIPLNFKMGRHGILQDSILQFTDDTIRFYISSE